MAGERRPRGGDDLDSQLAEPRADGHHLAAELGPDRVAVALEGDQRLRADDALSPKLGRKRSGRQAAQRLGVGEPADRLGSTATAIGDVGAEAIEVGLGLGRA